MVAPAVRELVRERAGRRCEYCRAPEEVTGSRYQIDHILPRSLGGGDEPENLALGCASCNLAKSIFVSGLDPETQKQACYSSPEKTDGRTILPLCGRLPNCVERQPRVEPPFHG